MARRRFHVHLSDRTETAALFTRIHIQRKGFLRTLLSAFVGAPIPRQKVRLLASEAGEGRTRLTVIELKQGEWPDEWPDIKGALEQWIVEELGGIYWPLLAFETALHWKLSFREDLLAATREYRQSRTSLTYVETRKEHYPPETHQKAYEDTPKDGRGRVGGMRALRRGTSTFILSA